MEFLYIICGIVALVLFFIIKNFVWNKPHEEIDRLKKDIIKLQELHKNELLQLQERLINSSSLHIQENEFADIIVSAAWRELSELCNKEYAFLGIPTIYSSYVCGKGKAEEAMKRRFQQAINEQYKYRYLIYIYPELSKIFDGLCVKAPVSGQPTTIATRSENLFEIVNILRKDSKKSEDMIFWKNRVAFLEASKSNLTAIPYMAEIMADYETYGLEHLAKELDWGYAMKRMEKVKAIRDIRKDAKAIVEKYKESQYQLAYLINLFPTLEDVIDAEFNQLPVIEVSELSDYDSARDFLSKEEYLALSEIDRNQLALDRYIESRKKSKWQIGRDYELYCGYCYEKKGFIVDYFGSYNGLEDLGRDLIIKQGNDIRIVQCKYWSKTKQIHENHIMQLYGSVVEYNLENKQNATGILITNIGLSNKAKEFAQALGISYKENMLLGEFPRIKCNIGMGEFGEKTKIYHLPFDQQYDATKIDGNGEFMAMTVAEAENAGFRRAYKWHGAE